MFNACMTIRTNLQHHNEIMVAETVFAFLRQYMKPKPGTESSCTREIVKRF